MVRRIIVRARRRKETSVEAAKVSSAATTRWTTSGLGTRYTPWTVVAPVFLAVGWNFWGSFEFKTWAASMYRLVSPRIEEDASALDPNVEWLAVVAFLGCLIAAVRFVRSIGESNDSAGNKGVAVMLYHAGVQLATVSLLNDRWTEAVTAPGNARFIPRDQIIDCVVTEVILAHKIQNVVVFRLHRRSSRTAHAHDVSADAIELVNAFPGVDLTYVECCAIRSQINSYLTLR